MTRGSLIIAGVLAVALAGCQPLAYFAYALLPIPRDKTIEAEFDGLAGHRVAIVVFSDQRTLYEYPRARLSVSAAVAEHLRRNVKDIEVISSLGVIKYQDENIYWDAQDKTKLAKVFGADYLLFITLVEFGTREPGSQSLYRGRVTAEVSVYDSSLPERRARVWKGDSIRIVHPEHGTGLLEDNDREIRHEAERMFADALVKKFYKHEVPIE